jgi:hypothetical protein
MQRFLGKGTQVKLNAFKTVLASAAVLTVAACGGGGGEPSVDPAPAVELSGTAAIGAALPDASVEVKCAEGSGTATTSTSGGFTVRVEGGALPCMVRVTGTVGGKEITLHSVAASGSSSNGTTNATANVTPITEMIVAQLTASLPADAFAAFAGDGVSQEAVKEAATAIVTALKNVGIDLGSIDPLQAQLVPADGSTSGNEYDQLLDKLGETVPPEALPQVVNQIANASSSGSSEGLQDAMIAVEGGTLPGCPAAVSGKYRTQDFFGRSQVRNVDFKNMKFSTEGSSEAVDITQDATDACKFKVSATVGSVTTELEAVIGAAGVGTFKGARSDSPPGTTGYIFPAQSHPVSAFGGDWAYVQSGFFPDEGLVHWVGKLGFGSDNKVSVCDYRDDSGTCHPDTEANLTVTARSDGGVDLNEPSQSGVASLWGYKAPNGSFTVFGTTNAAGVNDATTEQTHIVATRASKLALPSVGYTNTSWSAVFRQTGTRDTRTVQAPTIDKSTVISVDATEGWFTRQFEGSSAEELIYVNKPVDGFRKRQAASGVWFYQMPLADTGVWVGFNAVPGPSAESPYIHVISVNKP